MKRRHFYFLLVLVLMGSMSSCKNKDKKNKKPGKGKTSLISKQFLSNQLDFQWFNSKANVRFSDSKSTQSFSSTIRIRKDSVIWMTIKKLGIEGGRVLVRPDSIFVINRMQREYYARDYTFLEDEFNIKTDFNTLQQMLVGNALFLNEKTLQQGKGAEQYRLTSSENGVEGVYYLDPISTLLQKMMINDVPNGRELNLTFQNYKEANVNAPFSFSRKINMASPETGDVNLDINFSRVEFNVPKTMPFVVSTRYTIR